MHNKVFSHVLWQNISPFFIKPKESKCISLTFNNFTELGSKPQPAFNFRSSILYFGWWINWSHLVAHHRLLHPHLVINPQVHASLNKWSWTSHMQGNLHVRFWPGFPELAAKAPCCTGSKSLFLRTFLSFPKLLKMLVVIFFSRLAEAAPLSSLRHLHWDDLSCYFDRIACIYIPFHGCSLKCHCRHCCWSILYLKPRRVKTFVEAMISLPSYYYCRACIFCSALGTNCSITPFSIITVLASTLISSMPLILFPWFFSVYF